VAIHPSVGRCNHESGCGYHYPPAEFYQDHPTLTTSEASQKRINSSTQTPSLIPKQYLVKSLGMGSNFVTFLCSVFDKSPQGTSTIDRLMGNYCLGQTRDKSVIFWQLDSEGRPRTGKIMQYNPTTGKRIKDANVPVDWVHSRLKRDRVLKDDFNLVQCLFGAHLLSKYQNKTVALIESEKSAIIASGVYPNYVWVATGGKSQLSIDKLKVLRGRTVVMFPDVDGYGYWIEKAKEIEALGCKVIVSDLLEKNATAQDRDDKIDLADWLIRELRQQKPPVRVETPPEDLPIFGEGWEPIIDDPIKIENLNPNTWDTAIAELDTFFGTHSFPDKPIPFGSCVTITDVNKFIYNHMEIVKANNGNKTFLPYLLRLQQLQQIN
jgi:hypothetical protein